MSLNQRDKVLNSFDFLRVNKVRVFLHLLDERGQLPTVFQLKQRAHALLCQVDAAEAVPARVMADGFVACKDADGRLALFFATEAVTASPPGQGAMTS